MATDRHGTAYFPQIDYLESRRLMAYVPDGGFGVSGQQRYDSPGLVPGIIETLYADDEQLLIGGYLAGASQTPYIARLNADGTPDTGFAAGGHRDLPVSIGNRVTQVIRLNNGKCMVAGDLGVARISATGALDTSYDSDGVVETASDRITLTTAGTFFVLSGYEIRKYNASGALDTTWADAGVFDLATNPATADLLAGDTDAVVLIRRESTGGVTVAMDTTDESGLGDVGIIRINLDGTLNNTYGVDGLAIASASSSSSLKDLAVLPDNSSILLFNYDGAENATCALSATGDPIASSYRNLRSSEAYADEIAHIAVGTDGSAYLAGGFSETDETVTYAAVMKLNADQSIAGDFAIDFDGIATVDPLLDQTDGINGIAFQSAATDQAIYMLVRTPGGNVVMKLKDDPAGTIGINRFGNTLAIQTADTPDRILVGIKKGRVIVSIGGERASFTNRSGQFIEIQSRGGDDQITLDPSLIARSLFIEGGDGNDQIDLFDTLYEGADRRAFGGAGNDLIRALSSRSVMYGDAGNDTIFGSFQRDAVFGGDGNDLLVGGGDDDYIEGGAGRDTLDGSAGNDRLLGQSGNDLLIGGKNDDTLYGQSGNDTLAGGIGKDYFDAGPGDDRLESHDLTVDRLFGGGGNDLALVDALDLRDGVETVTGID